jgi:hypothetical protein
MPAIGIAIPWQFRSQIAANEEIGNNVEIRSAEMKVRTNTPLTAR